MVMGVRIDWDLISSIVILTIVIFIVVYLVTGCAIIFNTEAQCLELGYPSGSVTWNLKSYCISLYDAKPVVVPLR